jgi:Flp pilus assembly pilin Flp
VKPMVKIFTITENMREYLEVIVNEFLLSEKGATAIEYALLAALIGATVIGAQTAMGLTVVAMYQDAADIIIAAMAS